jgi:hypothetical protein
MKRIQTLFFGSALLLIMILITPSTIAQEPPHPPSTGHGVTGNQLPGGASAPVDGGISILLALGALYAGKRTFHPKKEK